MRQGIRLHQKQHDLHYLEFDSENDALITGGSVALVRLAQDGGKNGFSTIQLQLRPRRVDSQAISSSVVRGMSWFGHGAVVAPSAMVRQYETAAPRAFREGKDGLNAKA